MDEPVYTFVHNRGPLEGFEVMELDKASFIRQASSLLKKPKQVFLGLGDFIEIGDYNNLFDSILFEKESVQFENLLDNANRKIAAQGNIPFSFLKLAVYFPDYLLKNVPTYCASIVGKKGRLFPGAETFMKKIKPFHPIVISALPYEIAIEFVRRVGLQDENLISTEYRTGMDQFRRKVYAGGVVNFISGDRKSLEIEKHMAMKDLREDEVVYIGRGEAGVKTFSTVNSIAFNPPQSVLHGSKLTVYGSTLESLLVLFNYDGELDAYLMSDRVEEFLPSLIVNSDMKGKEYDLIELELQHRHLQNNILGQRIEHSAESYLTVERDIEIDFGGSAINMKDVKKMVTERMEKYQHNQQEFINEIAQIATDRYMKRSTESE